MGFKELRATYEMLVGFKTAILNTKWDGVDVEAVAMGLVMVKQMEGQYRVQVDVAEKREKEMAREVREAIKAAGGKISGETPSIPAA
jgi:hypothetical protein